MEVQKVGGGQPWQKKTKEVKKQNDNDKNRPVRNVSEEVW